MRVWLYREPSPAWPTDLSRCVEVWFEARGAECLVFNFDDLDAGKLDEDLADPGGMIVFGGIGAVRAVLSRMGRPLPDLPDFPDPLLPYVGRKVWNSTLKEIYEIVNREPERLPLHVKPCHPKIFTGVLVKGFGDLIRTAGIKDEEPVIMQEPVEFVSEWRATILRGDILNVAHYKGDPLRFPDATIMKAGVEAFVGQPVAYALDWGVTSGGRTLLVEANDAHSLGNYGLRGQEYCAVLIARWRQLAGVDQS